MVYACVVPGCQSNYRYKNGCVKKHIPAFNFPKKKELREAWLKAIRRKYYMVNQNSSVCILHFSSDCFSPDSNGTRLLTNAIPNIFPIVSNLNKRKENWDDNLIGNFSNLLSEIEKKVNLNQWFLYNNKYFVVLCHFKNDKQYGCKFKFRIKINRELRVRCFSDEFEVPSEKFESILPKTMKIEFWNQLRKLLCFVNNMEHITIRNDSSFYLTHALEYLQKYKASKENENIRFLDIAMDQIRMLTTKRFKYSTNSIKMSFSIFKYSKPSYSILSNFLAVPSDRYLQSLLNKTRMIENNKNEDHIKNTSIIETLSVERVAESPRQNEIDIISEDTIEWVDVDMVSI
ncbi:uncharacterized protein LOC129608154 [Condylostylus longicornis]|uniref:uncharacterized protein LOC129608154 n=1 Tax=Condylostylus longicornis TaxID=2530218 RepID=UPI00244E398C|nr:uncharacterized protein LOC129608154 [Condylostylus longicornis]